MDLLLLEGGPPPDSGTFEGSGAVSGLEPDLEPWGVSSPFLLESGSKGSKAPEGSEFGLQPNTAPKPPVVPDSGRQPPSKMGKTPVPVTSVHPEVPDNLLEALRSASIDEEHRTIMSAVVQKVRSAKSGLTEACASLLTGFEVSF